MTDSPQSQSSDAWFFLRRIGQHRLAAIGALIILIFMMSAIFAPLLAPHNPAALSLSDRLLLPSSTHWFGTDALGRDVLSRTLYGARVSLTVAVAVVSLSLAMGLLLGA